MRNRDGGETTSKEHYRSCLREKAGPWQAVINDRTVYNADKKKYRRFVFALLKAPQNTKNQSHGRQDWTTDNVATVHCKDAFLLLLHFQTECRM